MLSSPSHAIGANPSATWEHTKGAYIHVENPLLAALQTFLNFTFLKIKYEKMTFMIFHFQNAHLFLKCWSQEKFQSTVLAQPECPGKMG